MRCLPIVLAVAAMASDPVHAADRPAGRSFVTRSAAVGASGMAATSQPLATLAAVDVLRDGGSAIDAAIAANAVLALTEPTGCGLGGDLFALLWDPETKKLHGLNASGRSPRALTLDEFRRLGVEEIPALGPLPISVPGCVDGWATLHDRFGKLPLADVLAPAIQYAEEGFVLTEVIARSWAAGAGSRKDFPGFAEVFLPGGQPPAEGEVFKNPALARTLRVIADAAAEGGSKRAADAFYRGDIARTIDAFVRRHGGYLRYEDLAEHTSEWVEPIGAAYRGCTVWELPPNGQGLAALQMLRLLEGYDLAGAGFGSPNHLHWLVESKRLAFEDRARHYADPDFYQTPIDHLLGDQYTNERRDLIDDARAARHVEAGPAKLSHGDTVYLATADSSGMMVSLIQSNYQGFGSGLCPEHEGQSLGFCLQDRGQLFDLTADRPNSYAPGKRPFHTIIPAFITQEGQPLLAFGVMGGDMQPQGHAQIVVNLLDFGMGLQEAGDAPRVRHVGSSQPTGAQAAPDGGDVQLESGFSPETRRELVQRGHNVVEGDGGFGGYQAVWRDPKTGVYYGATESRKDGVALGY